MKIFFILCLVRIPFTLKAQQVFDHVSYDTVYTTYVDHYAAFPGGNAKLLNSLSRNLKLIQPIDEEIYSKIIVSFIVDRDGSISNIVFERPKDFSTENKTLLIKLLKSMPCWEPALLNNKPVRSQFKLPINTCYR
jgi:hypothetical protein